MIHGYYSVQVINFVCKASDKLNKNPKNQPKYIHMGGLNLAVRLTIWLLACMYLATMNCTRLKNEAIVYDLQCENLTDPSGIGTVNPRLSWKTGSEMDGTLQTAYQLLVASDSVLLDEKKADLWNPGKVSSSGSILVPYLGRNLKSGSVAYWKVRMWDERGLASDWSRMANFSVGLLDAKDWKSDYIGMPEINNSSGCPLLREKFSLNDPVGRCMLYVNSLGYHEVYINGKKIGKNVLSPAVSQFNKRSQVITYDVTSCMKSGENDLVIWLGRGWYRAGLPGVFHNGPLVRAQLEQMNAGSWKTVLVTGDTWKGRRSEYSLLGSWKPGEFGGEEVDASQIIKDWSSEGLDKLDWYPVTKVTVPDHLATSQMVEPNRIQESIPADTIYAISDSIYLADMGKNLTGWIKIDFPPLQKGQRIAMEYCDHLDAEGKPVDRDQKDIYLASGIGNESFMNKFNYHGFRYVKISKLEEMPSKESITGYLIHTDYRRLSNFACSDEDMNRIHDMIRYTIRCLSLGGYLVDCPQIERLGYGGDGNASTATAQTMFDLAPLYTNWLQAWGDCIRKDGGMPHTAPNPYPAGGGPYWCGFIISATWKTFLNYGDTLLLAKYYPAMQMWLKYAGKYSSSGILKRWPDTDYRNWYLGDWASPDGINEKSEASVDLVNNSYLCMCYDYMQKIARILGKKGDLPLYARKEKELKKQVHERFYSVTEGTYADGYQIDLTFPLLAGIVPDSLVHKVREKLHFEIERNRDGHIACGLVGIPVFTEWATEDQAFQLVYSMLKKKDYPGYLYMIDNGATTTWENWNNSRSYIHNCFNGIGTWFYEAIGGIRPEKDCPAWRHVVIQPQIPDGITWANTTKETPYGPVVLNWKISGSELKMHLEVPVGVSSKVMIPRDARHYQMNGKAYDITGDETFLSVESGKYDLSFVE